MHSDYIWQDHSCLARAGELARKQLSKPATSLIHRQLSKQLRAKSSKKNICGRCLWIKSLSTVKPATGINKGYNPDMDTGMGPSSLVDWTSIGCSTQLNFCQTSKQKPHHFHFLSSPWTLDPHYICFYNQWSSVLLEQMLSCWLKFATDRLSYF